MNRKKGNSYAGSGVDIKAGEKAVDLIKDRVKKTFRYFPGKVLTGIGGFSGIGRLPDGTIVASSTDGVGTKLMLAILLSKHYTVGIDLVAMCVNDIIVNGIGPAFFLDYIAMGKQNPKRTEKIVSGVIRGCEIAKVALLGGEMAEMPGMYKEDDYDMAGFAVGFTKSRRDLILGKGIKIGMKVYGIPSSGLHSNGYSLVRKIFRVDTSRPKSSLRNLEKYYPELGVTLGEELLKPTNIYVRTVEKLLKKYKITGMAHVTGGGIAGNLSRILPSYCSVEIKLGSWPVRQIFRVIQVKGGVSDREMRKTFNMGLGLIVISPYDIKEGYLIGRVRPGKGEVNFVK